MIEPTENWTALPRYLCLGIFKGVFREKKLNWVDRDVRAVKFDSKDPACICGSRGW